MDRFSIALGKIPEIDVSNIVTQPLPKKPKRQRPPLETLEDLWVREDRDSAREAAARLESKASNCIQIAQKILPKATDNVIETTAAELMHLTDDSVTNILQRIALNERTDS
jgi:hypothetical protein